METLVMSLRYIAASVEGVIKKFEVLSVSPHDAQRCTEALQTLSIFNAIPFLEEVTRDSMQTAVSRSGEKQTEAPAKSATGAKTIKQEDQKSSRDRAETANEEAVASSDEGSPESQDVELNVVDDTDESNEMRQRLRRSKRRAKSESVSNTDASLENHCRKCKKTFTNPKRLAVHMKSHDSTKPYRCHLCQHTFKYNRCLQQHLMVTHSDSRPEECELCHKRFKDKRVLSMHIATHSDKKFSCTSCEKTFTLEAQLTRHVRVKHMGIFPHECSICGKKYARKTDCETHMFSHQGLKPWKCSQCDKCYTNAKSLRMHEDSHRGKTFACPKCGKVYRLRNSLQDHMKRCQKSEQEKAHICTFCGKKFWTKNNLQDHMMVHTTEKSLMCNLCGKLFRREINLKAHMITHTGEKNFRCPHCSLAFGTKSNMDNHILRKHTDKSELPFRCSFCDKGLINKQELDQHILIHHTDRSQRPHKCEFCGTAFVIKRHLRDHVRIHTGEKPHKCTHCQKSFTQSSTLQKHLRTHQASNLGHSAARGSEGRGDSEPQIQSTSGYVLPDTPLDVGSAQEVFDQAPASVQEVQEAQTGGAPEDWGARDTDTAQVSESNFSREEQTSEQGSSTPMYEDGRTDSGVPVVEVVESQPSTPAQVQCERMTTQIIADSAPEYSTQSMVPASFNKALPDQMHCPVGNEEPKSSVFAPIHDRPKEAIAHHGQGHGSIRDQNTSVQEFKAGGHFQHIQGQLEMRPHLQRPKEPRSQHGSRSPRVSTEGYHRSEDQQQVERIWKEQRTHQTQSVLEGLGVSHRSHQHPHPKEGQVHGHESGDSGGPMHVHSSSISFASVSSHPSMSFSDPRNVRPGLIETPHSTLAGDAVRGVRPRPLEGPHFPIGIAPGLPVPPGVDPAQIIHNVITFQPQNFPGYQHQHQHRTT